jgi:hypothetical protein
LDIGQIAQLRADAINTIEQANAALDDTADAPGVDITAGLELFRERYPQYGSLSLAELQEQALTDDELLGAVNSWQAEAQRAADNFERD